MMIIRALMCGLVAVALMAQPAAARSAGENPYWESESSVPAETIAGEWWASGDGRSARLEIKGYNLPGQQTRFEAGWRTPWVSSKQSLHDSGTLDLFLSPVTAASLVEMGRFRLKGESWSQWFKGKLPYQEGLGMGGRGAWGGSASLFLAPAKVQYEWKLVGEIDGLATIDGTLKLSVR